jgi:uncharacterized protein
MPCAGCSDSGLEAPPEAVAAIALRSPIRILPTNSPPMTLARTMTEPEIPSPCNKVCVVDPASGSCIGCGRTLAEIASWLQLDAQERARIMADLPQRRAARLRVARAAVR